MSFTKAVVPDAYFAKAPSGGNTVAAMGCPFSS
jgi:hypothetical protein